MTGGPLDLGDDDMNAALARVFESRVLRRAFDESVRDAPISPRECLNRVLRHLGGLVADGDITDDQYWGCVRSAVELYRPLGPPTNVDTVPDYRGGCRREGCVCQTPGPVCASYAGWDGEGDGLHRYCPRCGWLERLHPTEGQRRAVLLEAAHRFECTAPAEGVIGDTMRGMAIALRDWAKDTDRWERWND